MRLLLHTLLCCCVLTAMMMVVRSAVVRKRVKGRLQTKRDAAEEFHMGPPQQGGDAKILWSPSSIFVNTRRRRSPSKTSGCLLFSCSYHDLIYRLSQMHDHDKKLAVAPTDKMNSIGRRRRSAETTTDEPVTQIPCWVCLLAPDRDKSSLVRMQSGGDRPRPTQRAP